MVNIISFECTGRKLPTGKELAMYVLKVQIRNAISVLESAAEMNDETSVFMGVDKAIHLLTEGKEYFLKESRIKK